MWEKIARRHLLKSQKYWNCKMLLGLIIITITQMNALFVYYCWSSECRRLIKLLMKWDQLINLFHMKITTSVTKSLHEDHGSCYLHLQILFIYWHSPPLLEKKVVLIAVFVSKFDHRPLFSDVYYETSLVWWLISIWLTNARQPIYSI